MTDGMFCAQCLSQYQEILSKTRLFGTRNCSKLGRSLYSCVCMCVYSNTRNDVARVAQRYGTIAAHTQRPASVLVVFVVFCVHMYSTVLPV